MDVATSIVSVLGRRAEWHSRKHQPIRIMLFSSPFRCGQAYRLCKPSIKVHKQMWPLLLCAAGGHNGKPARICPLSYLMEGKVTKSQVILSRCRDTPNANWNQTAAHSPYGRSAPTVCRSIDCRPRSRLYPPIRCRYACRECVSCILFHDQDYISTLPRPGQISMSFGQEKVAPEHTGVYNKLGNLHH